MLLIGLQKARWFVTISQFVLPLIQTKWFLMSFFLLLKWLTCVITYHVNLNFLSFTWTYLWIRLCPLTCCWLTWSVLCDMMIPLPFVGPKPWALTNFLDFSNPLFLSLDRGSVCNVLLTCCKDSVCRLWAETLLPGDSLLFDHHKNHDKGQHGQPLRYAGPSTKYGCNGKIQAKATSEVSDCNRLILEVNSCN